jgi:2'-5' RNA ligase
MRLFVAITPPKHVVEDLDAFLEVRREAGGALRWVQPDQWHLTLAFCSDFPDVRLDELEERLERAAARRHPVAARLAGGGAFPNVGRAKGLWLGLDASHSELDRMATGARAAVAKAGGQVDGQRFREHLTLARAGHPIEATRWVRLLDGYAGPEWIIDSLDLIASHLGEGDRGRPRHELLARFPLASMEA